MPRLEIEGIDAGAYGTSPNWDQMTPEERLKWFHRQPGTASFDAYSKGGSYSPGGSGNYWDKLMGAIVGNSKKLPSYHIGRGYTSEGDLQAGNDALNASGMVNQPESAQLEYAAQKASEHRGWTNPDGSTRQIWGEDPGSSEQYQLWMLRRMRGW